MTPTPLTSRAAGWVIFILALGAGFSVAAAAANGSKPAFER